MDSTTAYVLVVIFVATVIRSTIGFGEALVAVPLLAMRISIRTATPLAVMVSATIAAMVVVQDWRRIHWRSVAWLFASTLVGIPVGLWVLTAVHPGVIKGILGFTIAAFGLFSLSGRFRTQLADDHHWWMLGCGFVAGVLGGAFGMNGPPLAVYGAMRRWSAQHFRATLQAYFLPASLAGLIGYWMAGLCSGEVVRLYGWSLPATVGAVLIGRALNRRLRGDLFLKWVYAGLVAIGVVLVAQAVR